MANWKIQDIAPPKKAGSKAREQVSRETPQKSSSRKSKRLPRWFLRGVVPFFLLLLVSVGVVHVFFAKAEITLWPKTRVIKVLEPIVAEVGKEQLDMEKAIIPTRVLQQEKEATRLFPASSTTIKENRASGTLRVFNTTDSAKTLIAKTRFVSEGGKLFRTPVKVTIPGASGNTPGTLDIGVAAAEPGEDYNIGPSNFSLPGLSGSPLFTQIYAKSTQSMTGGSKREVSVVTREDIENAKEALAEELTQKAIEELMAKVPGHMFATKDSASVEIGEASSLVAPGAELDQFHVTASVTVNLSMFPRLDLDALVDAFLLEKLQEGERIFKKKTTVNFEQIAGDPKANTVSLDLSVEAFGYQYVDPTELKIKLRGKEKDEAQNILDSFGVFQETQISLWPFWLTSLPGNMDKLHISIVVDE